jgi:FSR family fosmidomycin resistance protein-like MFS transporter
MRRSTFYLLPFLAKSMSVYYFVLLPPLLAGGYITSAQVGYTGALSITALVIGAISVARWPHTSSKTLVQIGSAASLACVGLLGVGIAMHSVAIITLTYIIIGLQTGIAMSAANALTAAYTTRGKRFNIMARMSMMGDLNRIIFPIIVAGSLYFGGLTIALIVMSVMTVAYIIVANSVPQKNSKADEDQTELSSAKFWHNRLFKFLIGMEFLDSFASSQLFVFVPILFLSKGYSIESTLLLQTAIFIGYLSGRWCMGKIADRFSGLTSLILAECGMVVSIILLLLTNQLALLYLLTLLLGVFARGTGPVLRALVFDSLHDHHMKRGTAIHVVAGDSGSASGQLLFGLLLAWVGAVTPFIVAAGLAGVVVFLGALLFQDDRNNRVTA